MGLQLTTLRSGVTRSATQASQLPRMCRLLKSVALDDAPLHHCVSSVFSASLASLGLERVSDLRAWNFYVPQSVV